MGDVKTASEDVATRLVMNRDTLLDLELRARMRSHVDARANDLAAAITGRQVLSDNTFRIFCSPAALAFMREEAPDIARRWPSVFGEVVVPRTDTLAAIGAGAVGRAIVGVEIGRDQSLTLRLEGGRAILVGVDGSIDFDAGVVVNERVEDVIRNGLHAVSELEPTGAEVQAAVQRAAAEDDARGLRDR